jgi:hypothetical protein
VRVLNHSLLRDGRLRRAIFESRKTRRSAGGFVDRDRCVDQRLPDAIFALLSFRDRCHRRDGRGRLGWFFCGGAYETRSDGRRQGLENLGEFLGRPVDNQQCAILLPLRELALKRQFGLLERIERLRNHSPSNRHCSSIQTGKACAELGAMRGKASLNAATGGWALLN